MITLPRTSFHRVWSSLLLVALFLFIITVAWLTRSAFAASSTVKSGEHVLTIFDDGQQRGILTKANTLRDALAEANIALSKDDITEPSLDQKLVSSNYDVTIYRARPILIIDGESRTKVISAYHTGKQIAAQAGITLHDEDNVDIQYSPDVVADGAVERMVIKRATPFTLVLYGKTIASYTQSKTVKDMMSEKAIKLAADDTVSVPQSSTITAGMTVEIWRNGAQTTTVEEPVAFSTQRIQDANQPVGYKNVQTPGKDGTKMVTYQITVKNGVPVSKQAIQEVVTQQPVTQVEVVGAKAKPISGTCSEWMAAAGVPSTSSVNYLIGKESGCNPNSVNRSSGACGIGQALPCSKMGLVNPDGTSSASPVEQMQWMNSYVIGRYGSWDAAAAHHRATGWY